MTQIESAAAYVRSETPRDVEAQHVLAALPALRDIKPPDASVRIWELLETPQTVETICRVLNNEFDLPTDSCTQGVKLALEHLYREDLIQLSPDA